MFEIENKLLLSDWRRKSMHYPESPKVNTQAHSLTLFNMWPQPKKHHATKPELATPLGGSSIPGLKIIQTIFIHQHKIYTLHLQESFYNHNP